MIEPTLWRGWRLAFAALLLAVPFGVATAATTDAIVPMRDGVNLAATIYTPEGDGPWPTVLSRTPYNKDGFKNSSKNWTDNGYAFVGQDVRGRFASEGDYVPFENDMEDGYDTVEWVAAQDFCNGKIGITGGSALGITSNLAAAADPPHLEAAYVIVAPQSLFSESRFIGGVFKDSHAGGWMRRQGVPEQIPAMKARVVMDDQWKRTDLVHHLHKIDIPIYNVGGWYDIFLQGNILNFQYLQENGKGIAKGNQKLFMGAFGHGNLSGDLAYPDARSIGGTADQALRWFDYWLKGIDNGIMDEPPVTYYMMAAARKDAPSPKNRYLTAEGWPPPHTPTPLYLSDGLNLSFDAPVEQKASTSYKHDPGNPVPTVGGANLTVEKGPKDQREIGERDDYLRFETDVLEDDVVIAGPLHCELWAATDGPDTDFMVKVVDVYPDGYEAIVLDTPLRARYRFGRNPGDAKMMDPGVPEKLHIDLWNTAITFEKGHKIAVHISSSNFPRFEVNPNTGEAPGKSEMDPRVATNTIFHDAERPSLVMLPIMASDTEKTD